MCRQRTGLLVRVAVCLKRSNPSEYANQLGVVLKIATLGGHLC